eukprot:TRINITY_DN4192_c0_g1_i1.p1 TRINITY_DN4192_c0_g1~~TRINITY_DN4192_c0_g1_i1.p1  ORF type:complete len:452 (+),score=33.07 TRINITY_DN4192_c0_g1_i1:73-1428(+)
MSFRRSMSIVEKSGGIFRPQLDNMISIDVLGRQAVFIESEYISSLRITCNGDRIKGTYHPPESEKNPVTGMLRNDVGKYALLGMAYLEGHVKVIGGVISIQGTWRHIDSAATDGEAGLFRMQSASLKEPLFFSGWWQDDASNQHDWHWKRNEHRDLATRFFESVWVDRYAMFCAWLFFIMTSIQLASASYLSEFSVNVHINVACNCVYAVCYTSFLVAFASSNVPKSLCYTLGVAAYAVGYFVFAAIYSDARGKEEMYSVGSCLFLSGSLLLMISSVPDGRSRWHAYSPLRVQSAIWWGSTLFCLGSVVFLLDSFRYGNSWINSVVGLSLFTMGRCFFIRGSQTSRCTWLFFSVETILKLPSNNSHIVPNTDDAKEPGCVRELGTASLQSCEETVPRRCVHESSQLHDIGLSLGCTDEPFEKINATREDYMPFTSPSSVKKDFSPREDLSP